MALLFAAFVVAGCGDRVKKLGERIENLADQWEPLEEVEELEEIEKEEPEPVIQDGTFDDFFYAYVADSEFRKQRTKFPLPYYQYDEPLKLEEEQWASEDLFASGENYSVIFDKEEELEMEVDTLTSIQFEWITLENLEVEKLYFERINGVWTLEAVNVRALEEGDNADFVQFYQKFAADSLFQQQHVKDPLTYITVDPDNDFSILESFIDAEQWPAFRPDIPTERLSNIYYGQRNENASVEKILKLVNMEGGYSSLLYFRKFRGSWQLYRYEDTSV